MACINCHRIRSAILHGKMAEALNVSVEMLREKIGIGPGAPSDFPSGGVLETGAPDSIPVIGESGPEAVVPKRWTKKYRMDEKPKDDG
ncbi:MAG: hypothetical protein RL519_1512 [Pseudomonadota bacterium]|jgi:hypothetical protein